MNIQNQADRIEIGVATIEFNSTGTFKSSIFRPTLEVVISTDVLRSIDFNNSEPVESSIKDIADISLASFFDKMSTIELSDREKFEVVSEVQKDQCEVYDSGSIKTCVLKYYFQKR